MENAKTRNATDRPALLSANDLLSGRVVYWTGEGWSVHAEHGVRAIGATARADIMKIAAAEEAQNTVVGAYLVDVDAAGDGIAPLLRERHRMAGPSIALPFSNSLQMAAE